MLRVEQKVGALDVPVDEALAVEKLQRARRIRENGHAQLPSHLAERTMPRETKRIVHRNQPAVLSVVAGSKEVVQRSRRVWEELKRA